MRVPEAMSVALGDLCDLVTEHVDPADVPKAVYVGLEHVPSGRLLLSSAGRGTEVQSFKFAFRRGDVLYGRLRPYLDKAIFANSDGICTTELLVLRARPGVDARFLACVVHDDAFVKYAMSGVRGAHHPRTSWSHIAQFVLPRFTAEEQAAIARLLWRTHDLLAVTQELIETGGRLKLAAMRELFTRGVGGAPQKKSDLGPLPQNWDIVALPQVCTIRSGGTPPKSDAFVWSGNVPWVSGKDLKRNRLTDSNDHITEEAAERYSRVAPAGSVLVLVRGMGLANGFALSLIERDMAFNQDLKALIPKDVRRGAFLMHALTFSGQRMLRNVADAAHGTKRLTQDDLDRFEIPWPPQAEQDEIAAILDAIDRKIELHRQKRTVLEELFKSLLHKLMTGQIRVADLDLSALEGTAASEKAGLEVATTGETMDEHERGS